MQQTKVKQIISEQLGVQLDEVTGEKHLIDDFGADSLDQIELIMALEKEFDIEIPEEELEKLKTVQDVVDYIGENAN